MPTRELMESIEADEELMESYLGGEEISPEKLSGVIVKAMQAGTLIPVLFTDARHEVGITELLDMIADYAPSPAEAAPLVLKNGDEKLRSNPIPTGRCAGLSSALGLIRGPI